MPSTRASVVAFVTACLLAGIESGGPARAATVQKRYYAYEAVHDRHGVVAPWYKGQNGQLDFRVRVAAETLKRYPWADATKAPRPLPEYIYSGAWKIAPDGTITIPPINDWANGDICQRAAYVLGSLIDYYRYAGDPAAVAHLSLQADALLDFLLTPDNHPWPRFPVSVPTKGRPYGPADPRGFIQLDIVAEVGIQMVRASQLCGNRRWFEAAAHWGDLLAEKRCREPGLPPWPRYANPLDAPWEDISAGGVAFILDFFDELIRAGHRGRDGAILEARKAGVAYLRDVLLPNWLGHDTWGRNYWDWPCFVQVENVTEFAARYLMTHPDEFANWRSDTRNIATLFLNRTGASPGSRGDVYSGAWAYPESSSCCGRSLWYGPMELANVYAQYGELTGSEWAREMARRQILLATYDCRETGVVEDNIDGGAIVAGDWFKIAHPMALKHVLAVMAWMPDVFGAARENHILRSSAVVTNVVYGDGEVRYTTFDAPADTVDVLRLAFGPREVLADGKPLALRTDAKANGYQVRPLACGDAVVTIRHDGAKEIVLRGDDPQTVSTAVLDTPGTGDARCSFEGNQVRVIGSVGPDGGLADVYLDDVKQLCGIDCWAPAPRDRQVLYYRNGLPNGPHTIRVEARGAKNPLAGGTQVRIAGFQHSAAVGDNGFGEGGGPTDAQRWVFGYPERKDYIDSAGQAWRPATEFIIRSGDAVDTVASAWWTARRWLHIEGTPDPELYRRGVHGREFWADFTVGPGTYHARLKFLESRTGDVKQRAMTVWINGREVVAGFDIAGTAAAAAKAASGLGRPVDLVFNDIAPVNGVISIRFAGTFGGEAIVQAIEIGPGDGGKGAAPVCLPPSAATRSTPGGNLLRNPGFEDGVEPMVASLGGTGGGKGWAHLVAGPSQCYIWAESAYLAHPDWGLPVYHSGKEALRTHTDGHGHTIVWQDVEIDPGAEYTASVWVQGVDLHGKGFGRHPCDSAGLIVQELDKAGAIVAAHAKAAITAAGDYRQVSRTFVANARTAKVRFILDTVIACPYDQGHATYDDCSLVRQR